MIVKKIIETFLDINEPNEIFSTDRNQMIIDKLTEKFVGICYNSCLILKINKIIRRSYIYMKDTLDGDAYTNVMFEVDCVIYIKDEIINGCKIIKKEPNGIIHAKSKYAGIQLNIQPSMSILKEKDIVPVIVKLVRYNINQSAISVLAMPFMPIMNPIQYYNINGTLSKSQSDNLKLLMDQVKEDENKIKKLNSNDKKIYKFFNDLLHYKNKESTPKSNSMNIMDILNLKTGIVFQNMLTYDDSNINYMEKKEDSKAVDESPFIIFSTLLINYLSHLQTLNNFLDYYPTFTDVQKNKNTWKFYSMFKK